MCQAAGPSATPPPNQLVESQAPCWPGLPGPWQGQPIAPRTFWWYPSCSVLGAEAWPGPEAGSKGRQVRVPRWLGPSGLPGHVRLFPHCGPLWDRRVEHGADGLSPAVWGCGGEGRTGPGTQHQW